MLLPVVGGDPLIDSRVHDADRFLPVLSGGQPDVPSPQGKYGYLLVGAAQAASGKSVGTVLLGQRIADKGGGDSGAEHGSEKIAARVIL